ncbi:MAG: ABC transporter substrate-binding protein [Dehalococcoidia bacterium]|nr:ABC transporter substrate-binding protein [Dehalococcoidia bacterium]
MASDRLRTPRAIILTPLILLLVFAVACGAAATAIPAPTAKPTGAPAPVTAPQATAAPTPVAPPAAPTVNPGKVTILVAGFGAERFDTNYASTNKEIRKNFHGHLTSMDVVDGRLVIVPGIASKWEISNGGRTTTYTIRKGAKFHDGTEITAEDVLWTLQHGIGSQARGYSKSSPGILYSTIMDRIELTGPDQVSVTTKIPAPEMAVYISENEGGATQGQVLPKRAVLHDEKDAEAFEAKPIGAGPGKVVKRVSRQSITFERFDDFYFQPKNGFATDKRYKFKELELVQIPEESTRAAAIRSGDGDIATISVATRKLVESGGSRIIFGQESVFFEAHIWGCWKPQFPCSDKRVRQALNYAFDKKVLQERLMGGPEVMDMQGWWAITPSTIGYSPELAPWPFDPNRARQLMAEAGYKTPTNPGGKDFGKLVINTNPDELIVALVDSAQLAADFWKRELGIEAELKTWDKSALTGARAVAFEQFDGQITWLGNNTRLDAAGVTRNYYLNLQKGGPSARQHADPELLALVEKSLNGIGQPGFEKDLNSMYRRLRDEAYDVAPGGYINAPFAVGPRIKTWQPYRVAEYASAMHTIVLK